jgi:putative ABC transport system substrate-binding protein
MFKENIMSKNLINWKKLFSHVLSFAVVALAATVVIAKEKVRTVAITQIVEHPALTQAYHGVIAGLKEQGFVEGKNLKIIHDNAHGNITTAAQIAQKFVSLSPDVIVPISTPSAQAVFSADTKANIPIVFSTVTDPVAAQLVPSLKHPGGHVTGAIDLPPLAEQLKIIREILPHAKKLGVLYNAAEINSVRMIEQLKAANGGLTIIEAHASSSNEVSTATLSLIGKVDAIYVPMDNTVISAINVVLKIATKNHLAVFTSDHDSVEQGALAALAYDQYDVGHIAGKMVAEVLNGKNPGTIDVASPPKASLYINKSIAEQLKIKIPEKALKSAAKLVTTGKIE